MVIFNEHTSSNNNSGDCQNGSQGVPGQPGLPGVGFKLTKDGNYNMDNKRIYNLDTQDYFRDGDYDDLVKDMKSAVNKVYMNDKFLKKVKDGNYSDLRENVRNTEPYFDGYFGDIDIVSKKYIDVVRASLASKTYVDQ